jgi:hypothetical protein
MAHRMGLARRVTLLSVAMSCAVLAPVAALADDGDTGTTSTTSTTSTTMATTTTTTTASTPPAASDTPPAPVAKPRPRPTFTPVKRYDVKRKMVFPVIGVSKFWSGFGDCRDNCTREHHGIDIVTYGWKGLPVVAAHDGTVVKVTYDEGNAGCSVRIRARDGWETRYYHLNNDLPGSDEDGFPCPAPGIEVGKAVTAGQIIGYIGDSGNAEDTVPHLHFELRNRSGYPIDPYKSLRAAAKVTYEWLPSDPQGASLVLSQQVQPDEARVAVVVPSEELHRLGASESEATILNAPLVVIDKNNPQPAIDEIHRLSPERIIGITDDNADWLRDLIHPLAPIFSVDPLTKPTPPEVPTPHDAGSSVTALFVPDRFPTVIAGVVDRLRKSQVEAFDTFTTTHRSIILTTDTWAPRRIGVGSWTWPGKYADKNVVWWLTGDGWTPTAPTDTAPDAGCAYVTERLAVPQTLAYLGSLTELPPMPVWRSS